MGRSGLVSSLNKLVREIEKEERAREKEYKARQRYYAKVEKEKAKERKQSAKSKGYIFASDTQTKLDDASRCNGSIRDYIFYQFFALDDDFDDLTEEQKSEIIPTSKKFVAEWRLNNIPEI